jgi:acyl dehydratase
MAACRPLVLDDLDPTGEPVGWTPPAFATARDVALAAASAPDVVAGHRDTARALLAGYGVPATPGNLARMMRALSCSYVGGHIDGSTR